LNEKHCATRAFAQLLLDKPSILYFVANVDLCWSLNRKSKLGKNALAHQWSTHFADAPLGPFDGLLDSSNANALKNEKSIHCYANLLLKTCVFAMLFV
jgi:hypothetical protein